MTPLETELALLELKAKMSRGEAIPEINLPVLPRTSTFEGEVDLERFEIIDIIAQGGLSEIYLAKDTEKDRLVVVKKYDRRISPKVTDPLEIKSAINSFVREASATAHLDDPRVVHTYGFAFEKNGFGDRPVLIQEYVENSGSLESRLHEGTVWSEEEVRQVMTGVGSIIGFLQAHPVKQVFHADINPGNILLIDDENLPYKLADFAGARVGEKNRTATILGQDRYAPPEQLMKGEVNRTTALHALSRIAYAMALGGEEALDDRLFDNEPASVALKGRYSEQLAHVIERATDPSISNRYESFEEMIKDLDNYQPESGFAQKWRNTKYVFRELGASLIEGLRQAIKGDRLRFGIVTQYRKLPKTAPRTESTTAVGNKRQPLAIGDISWESRAFYEGNTKKLMTYDTSLARIKEAGLERHPRPAEVFDLLARGLEEKLSDEERTVHEDMLRSYGEWLSAAIQVNKEGDGLTILTDPENLIWRGNEYVWDGEPRHSSREEYDVSGIQLQRWINLERLDPELIQELYGRTFKELPEQMRTGSRRAQIYLPRKGTVWPLGRGNIIYNYYIYNFDVIGNFNYWASRGVGT